MLSGMDPITGPAIVLIVILVLLGNQFKNR